jgi:2-C-methyl-D-erythritol 4-phosphate cytidylyltransferase
MIYGAILAAGTGNRMNSPDVPKQFLDLAGRPVFIHSVERFKRSGCFDLVFVGVNRDWIDYANFSLARHLPERSDIRLVEGGASRIDTLINILGAIAGSREAEPGDLIVTHDSARPFVSERIITENIKALALCSACDTVVPSTDTVVVSRDGKSADEIPIRDHMYMSQTPQSFRLGMLSRLCAGLTQAEKDTLTDACRIFALAGEKVALVAGERTNFKITTKEDFALAKSIASLMAG